MRLQQNTETDFDDSHLQKAVRKCWAAECCPTRLRQRVEAMLRDAEDDRPGGPIARWGRWILYPLAAAAVIGLVVGLKMYNPAVAPPVNATAVVIPAALQTELVATHDRCSQKPSHQGLGDGDDTTLARAMTAQLHRPVLVARPSESGWDFRGAAVCKVGSTESGHLVFTSGSDALSVFSLPKDCMPNAADGTEFEAVSNGHPIVGFVRDNAVFCLVGSGPDANVSAPRLEALRSKLEPRITEMAAAANADAPVVAVELIRPIDR
jgi:hypothetical protein